LHIALCNADLRLPPETPFTAHVLVVDRIGRHTVDQSFPIMRETQGVSSVSWDMPWGEYLLTTTVRGHGVTCSGRQYFGVLVNHNREIDVSVHERPQPLRVPALVMGTSPFAFSYVQPTVELFDKTTKCNGPIGTPLDADVVMENDEDGYYGYVYPTRTLLAHAPVVVAVRLTDSSGGYKYIHIPTDFLGYSTAWPSSGELDINDGLIDSIAAKPEDTLICPHFYETITH
jgi:hypothetical protein